MTQESATLYTYFPSLFIPVLLSNSHHLHSPILVQLWRVGGGTRIIIFYICSLHSAGFILFR